MKKKVLLASIGAILGIPLSYYFQPALVRAKTGGIGGYLQNFGDIISEGNLVVNVILSVIIFALVGGIIGYFIDKIEEKKAN